MTLAPSRPTRVQRSDAVKNLMRLMAVGLVALPMLASAAGTTPDVANARPAQRVFTEADRKVEAGRLLLKWGGYVEKVEGQDRKAWAARLWPSLAAADLSSLQQASRAVTYEGMRNALLGQRPYDHQIIDRLARSTGTAGGPAGKALGSLASDLVFTPITPCRIVDTRVAVGRIAANATRNLIASNPAGTFLGQGGASTNCGIPSNPAAVALSVTGLGNTSTGFLRVFPANGSSAQGSPIPLNAINTTATNDIIVPACQACASDLKVFSTANTHYAAFVTGYYMAPQATTLECTSNTVSFDIPANGSGSGLATCPATYVATGGGCTNPGIDGSLRVNRSEPGRANNAQWYCHFSNLTGSVRTGNADARCCRVPGRTGW